MYAIAEVVGSVGSSGRASDSCAAGNPRNIGASFQVIHPENEEELLKLL